MQPMILFFQELISSNSTEALNHLDIHDVRIIAKKSQRLSMLLLKDKISSNN